MSNPVPGLCPCCKNPKNSDFLQSIHSEGLFKMVEKLAIGRYGRTKLGRRYLFCNQCINWGKSEVLRLREEERLHQAGPSHQSGPLHQAVSFQHGGIIQHHGALQQSVVHAQPHYSPVSDPEGSHSTPEPFNMNQMYTQENLIGARLANPNDSPIHLAILPYFLSTGSRPAELPSNASAAPQMTTSAPLPSPLEENPQIWDMDDAIEDVNEVIDKDIRRERADEPE